MKTFNQFLEILQEKKKDKKPKFSKKKQRELKNGIVVEPKEKREPDGTLHYNLSDFPRPVPTEPGSPERDVQVAVISGSSGGGAIKRAQKQMKKNKKP